MNGLHKCCKSGNTTTFGNSRCKILSINIVAGNVSLDEWMAFISVVRQGIQRHLEIRGARF